MTAPWVSPDLPLTPGRESWLLHAWITLALFLFSLGSYYFYNLELYVLQVAGLVIVLPLFRLRYLDGSGTKLILLVGFFMYAFVIGSLSALSSGSNIFQISKLALPLFFFMWLSFASVMFRGFPLIFNAALRRIIILHVACFVVQFSCYMLTSTFIDFLEPITGETQRALGGSYEISIFPAFLRATGLYNEPGTYSTWLMLMLLLYKENSRRLGVTSQIRFLEIAVVGTVLLSFSTFGLVFASVYILSIVAERGFNIKVLLLVAIFATPFAIIGAEFLDQRIALGTEGSGLGFRYQAMELYVNGLNWWNVAFGLGMFNDFFARADASLVYLDVGFWFVIVTSVGLIGSTILMTFLAISVPRNVVAFTMIAILLLSKFPMTSALIWFVLAYFIWRGGIERDIPARKGVSV